MKSARGKSTKLPFSLAGNRESCFDWDYLEEGSEREGEGGGREGEQGDTKGSGKGSGPDWEWRGPYYYVHIADPQLGFYDDSQWNEDGTDMGKTEKEEITCQRAVAEINQMTPPPAFVVICGDLTHAPPGTEHYDRQTSVFQSIFSQLNRNIPLVIVSGNHDVGNQPNAELLGLYRERYGRDYFAFWVGGVRYIVLNTQLYMAPSECMEERLKQNQWLERELGENSIQSTHTVIFQHIPPVHNSLEEKNTYFNLPINERFSLLKTLCSCPTVRYIFCGHTHKTVECSFLAGELSDLLLEYEAKSNSKLVNEEKQEQNGEKEEEEEELDGQLKAISKSENEYKERSASRSVSAASGNPQSKYRVSLNESVCSGHHPNYLHRVHIASSCALGKPLGPPNRSGVTIVQVLEDSIMWNFYPVESIPRTVGSNAMPMSCSFWGNLCS
eukprot:Nk52_evm9s266 gene=Nk52_evmTU9s266